MDDPLLTVKDVAQRLKLSEKTIRRWIAQGRLRAVKLSNRAGWRIHGSEVERLLRRPNGQ